MSFKIVRKSVAKAYIEERIPSKIIGEIDNLALTLDFIYDFIDKGDYQVDINLYQYIADIVDSTELIESEPLNEAIEKMIILTDKYNKSDITIGELIEEFNKVFSTNIVKKGKENKLDNNMVKREIKIEKPIDRFYNEMSDILGTSRSEIINNILTNSMANIMSASTDSLEDFLEYSKGKEEKEKIIKNKKEEVNNLKNKYI